MSAHRGPYAVFTRDELDRIRTAVFNDAQENGGQDECDRSILDKVRTALASDPKFRTPTK